MKNKQYLFFSVLIITIILISSCGTTKTVNTYKDDRNSIDRDKIVNYAKKQIGIKYTYAGNSPKEGFDCSGFTKYVFSHFGYDVPRRSIDYEKAGKKITVKESDKADILLFTGRNKRKRVTGHVGIVVSNSNGALKFIHASTSRGIVISDMNVTYYKERILGARRIIY